MPTPPRKPPEAGPDTPRDPLGGRRPGDPPASPVPPVAETPPPLPLTSSAAPVSKASPGRGGRRSAPAAAAGRKTTTAVATVDGPCGSLALGTLDLPDFDGISSVPARNIRSAAVAYYVGTFERIGALRAMAVFGDRYIGGMNVGSGDLAAKLCRWFQSVPARAWAADRTDVVLRVSADPALERLMVRLSDATIAWDLMRSPAGFLAKPGLAKVSEPAARLRVALAIEDLQLHLGAVGGGGLGLVAHMLGEQLLEVFKILGDDELRCHLPGDAADDMFSIIGMLVPAAQRPSIVEARQLARMASSGRKVFLELAGYAGERKLAEASEADLARLGDAAYAWRAAHGTADADDGADDGDDKVDERELQVIRLRRRGA